MVKVEAWIMLRASFRTATSHVIDSIDSSFIDNLRGPVASVPSLVKLKTIARIPQTVIANMVKTSTTICSTY